MTPVESRRMEHQWWCGGKEPCACTDGWKQGQRELGAVVPEDALPTKQGWYWFLPNDGAEPKVVHVVWQSAGLGVAHADDGQPDYDYTVEKYRGKFIGPIAEPTAVKP
jgi:hypothetical protein